MKKEIIFKLVSAVMALSVLASCSSAGAGKASSVLTESEKQNGAISSIASVETSSEIASSDIQTSSKENDIHSNISSTPKKQETSSKESGLSSESISSEFKQKKVGDLSAEKVNEISAYIKKDNYEYQDKQYFGTYNQYDVVLVSQIDGVEYEDAKSVKIAGYEFLIGTTEKLIAYKDNSYMDLSEAYNKGFITKNDVQNIDYHYRYFFYYKFRDDCILVLMKKDVNNPDKEYTAADFPALNIKSIDQSLSLNYEGEEGKLLAIYLPIKNRRNVCNAMEQVKKMENVIFVEPDHMISPFV